MRLGWKALLFLGALGLVSLGLKVIFERQISYNRLEPQFLAAVERGMKKGGFQVLSMVDRRTMLAAKDQCYVWIGTSRPEEGDEPYFIESYGPLGKLSYWYRGDLLPELPNARALIDRYLARLRMAAGAPAQLHPIYHIVSTAACSEGDIKALPLEDGL